MRKSKQDFQQMSVPSLKTGTSNQRQISPVIAPTGGFFSGLRDVTIAVPTRAFINNNMMAQQRAVGTVPENAMTPDVHSQFWSFGR
jgi:hypothetical protein